MQTLQPMIDFVTADYLLTALIVWLAWDLRYYTLALIHMLSGGSLARFEDYLRRRTAVKHLH